MTNEIKITEIKMAIGLLEDNERTSASKLGLKKRAKNRRLAIDILKVVVGEE